MKIELREHKILFEVYKDHNKEYHANKVAVYCETEKKTLIDSNFLKSNQLEVVGCARSDYCYELRNEKPLENKVIFFNFCYSGKLIICNEHIYFGHTK